MAVMYFNEKLNRVVIVNYSSDPFNKYEINYLDGNKKSTIMTNYAKFGKDYKFMGIVSEELVRSVN